MLMFLMSPMAIFGQFVKLIGNTKILLSIMMVGFLYRNLEEALL